jgi:hypothetical protein
MRGCSSFVDRRLAHAEQADLVRWDTAGSSGLIRNVDLGAPGLCLTIRGSRGQTARLSRACSPTHVLRDVRLVYEDLVEGVDDQPPVTKPSQMHVFAERLAREHRRGDVTIHIEHGHFLN